MKKNKKIIKAKKEEDIELQKAFALACRTLSDFLPCPPSHDDEPLPASTDEDGICIKHSCSQCWQRFFIDTVANESVCRVCGCTWNNACEGGCYWVEPDLCSSCANIAQLETADVCPAGLRSMDRLIKRG